MATISPNLIQQGAYNGSTRTIQVDYTDFANAAANSVSAAVLDATNGNYAKVVGFKVTEAFLGGALTAVTIKGGSTIAGADFFTAESAFTEREAVPDEGHLNNKVLISLTATYTGGTKATLTQGKAEVYVEFRQG
tara:strand:- start:22 stop:426 length:405 start_codon:yes stop_codon:yes gene_type:complete